MQPCRKLKIRVELDKCLIELEFWGLRESKYKLMRINILY